MVRTVLIVLRGSNTYRPSAINRGMSAKRSYEPISSFDGMECHQSNVASPRGFEPRLHP